MELYGEWKYHWTCSYPQRKMEVIGQLRASAVCSLRKCSQYLLNRRLCGSWSRSGCIMHYGRKEPLVPPKNWNSISWLSSPQPHADQAMEYGHTHIGFELCSLSVTFYQCQFLVLFCLAFYIRSNEARTVSRMYLRHSSRHICIESHHFPLSDIYSPPSPW